MNATQSPVAVAAAMSPEQAYTLQWVAGMPFDAPTDPTWPAMPAGTVSTKVYSVDTQTSRETVSRTEVTSHGRAVSQARRVYAAANGLTY